MSRGLEWRSRRSSWLQLVFVLGLSSAVGCTVSRPPTPTDLGVDVPTQWTALGDSQSDGLAGESSWWRQFDDRELDRLVVAALANNRDLVAASARVDAAVAQARIAGADLQPQLDVGASGARRNQNFIGFPIPGRDQEVLSVTSSSFGASLNISWEVDLWGRLRAQRDAASSRSEASGADYDGARLSLTGQVAKGWFAAVEARQQLDLAEATLESRRKSRERIERRYRSGTRPALDLRFAISNESAARANLASRQRQLDRSVRQLQLLLSRYPDGFLSSIVEGVELCDPPPKVPAGLPSELVTRRPDLVASENRLVAAGLDVTQARANLYPRLRLTGSGGTLSADVQDLLNDSFSVWSLAADILQPVFQGGRLRAGVDLSEARLREASELYAQQILRAFGEVEAALAADTFLADRELALREAAKQSTAAEKLANNRYEYGLDGYLAVLEAQRNAFLAQSEWISARRD
ncbi:MAG: efflux transporter outer membrane subunit, partial [Acidobacteriota bacterium]